MKRNDNTLARTRAGVLAAGTTLFLANAAQAQDESDGDGPIKDDAGVLAPLVGGGDQEVGGPISTGRPSFAAGPTAIPRGFLQIEGGYVFNQSQDGGEAVSTGPLLTLRAGVSDRSELRLLWSGYRVAGEDGESDYDANDLGLGFKTQLYGIEGGPLAIGLVAGVSLPVGTGDASTGTIDPNAALAFGYSAGSSLSLFGLAGVNLISDQDDDRYANVVGSFGANYTFVRRLTGFVEYFPVYDGDDGTTGHNLDGGLLVLVTNHFQLDFFGRYGLDGQTDDFALGAGFGVRF